LEIRRRWNDEAGGIFEMLDQAKPEEQVKYLPPFDIVMGLLVFFEIKGEQYAVISKADLVKLIKLFLAGAAIDEEWYQHHYKDIRSAIASGGFPSARLHFINHGYFEGRLAFPHKVNEASYIARYPDIANGIAGGIIKSATQHYVEYGYKEGRTPDDV
jgi:hypothetical protein